MKSFSCRDLNGKEVIRTGNKLTATGKAKHVCFGNLAQGLGDVEAKQKSIKLSSEKLYFKIKKNPCLGGSFYLSYFKFQCWNRVKTCVAFLDTEEVLVFKSPNADYP